MNESALVTRAPRRWRLPAAGGIEVGVQAAPSMPVFSIAATDAVQVRAGAPEAEIGRIRIGQSATIRVPALPDQKFFGRVKLIGAGGGSGLAHVQREDHPGESAKSAASRHDRRSADPTEYADQRAHHTQSNRSKGNQSWPS